jgi:3-hydroxyisobutyrate dehydrogenase-like beta-hydroxyacid dehydrogenase
MMSSSPTTTSLPRIGFIGIGLMGQGMASNLLAKGYPLSVRVHRNRAAAEVLLGAGAKETASNLACAQASDILFLCVTGSRQVEEIVLGGEQPGVLSASPAGLTIIDCSTAEPASTTRVREACEKQGVTFIDAPLARTPKEAQEGRLNIMVGASEADFLRIKPVLAAFCENIFHVGGPGAGHTMKLVNNFVSLAQIAALAEGYAAAAKAGLDLKKLFDLMSVGAVNSGLMQGMIGGALEGDLERLKFSIANAQKDLSYYGHLTEQLGMPAPVAQSVHQAFVQASALGLGEAYTPSMLKMHEQINGLSIVAKVGKK